MIDNGIDRIDRIDRQGRLVATNAIGERALGLSGADAATGTDWLTLWRDDQRAMVALHLARSRTGRSSRFTAASGSFDCPVWWDVVISRIADNDFVAQARDVTQAQAIEDDFRHCTRHDDLTGLLNRSAFKAALRLEVADRTAKGGNGTVLMLDLDNFKFINDTMGHDSGDRILQGVARALQSVAGPGEYVARLGGDEFAMLLPSVGDSETLRARAEIIAQRLSEPIDVQGRILTTRASIGAVQFPKHGTTPVELMKNADTALYAAKAFGRGGFTQFVTAMAAPMQRRVATMAAVRDAIANDRVDAFYQPVFDLATGSLHGFEASLHVFQDSGRSLSPLELRMVQDDVDLAQTLGGRLLTRLIEDVRHWRASGLAMTRIAVNIAAAEFRSGSYAERFLHQLTAAGLPPGLFDVEVAETVFAGCGTEYVAVALKTLRAAGVGISLDSFGTGPASLSNLKRLPVDSIKIDASFIEGVEHDAGDSAIVRAIVGIAHGFGIGLGAGGISTPGQAKFLQALGCNTGQGDLFGAADSFESILPLLRRRPTPAAIAGTLAGDQHLAETGGQA